VCFTVSQKIDARPPQQRAQSQQRQSPRTNHINKRPWRRVRRFSPRRFLNDATHAQHNCLASAPRSPSINRTQLMTSLPKPDLRSSARTPTYPSFAPRGARQVNETAPKTRGPSRRRSAIGDRAPMGACHTKTLRKHHNQRAPTGSRQREICRKSMGKLALAHRAPRVFWIHRPPYAGPVPPSDPPQDRAVRFPDGISAAVSIRSLS